MGNKYLISLLLTGMLLFWSACGGSSDDSLSLQQPDPSLPGSSDYISSVQITNKADASAFADNKEKTVVVRLTRNEDKTNVIIKLVLAEGVEMASPKELEAEYDLTVFNPGIWLSYRNQTIKYGIKVEYEVVDEVDLAAAGWTEADGYGSLPDGVSVYKSPDRFNEKNIRAFIAIVDMSKGRKFLIAGSDAISGGKTPDAIYGETQYAVILNGGYFYYSSATAKLHHIGLLVQNGSMVQNQTAFVTRPDTKGVDASYFPTRAVFGLSKGGLFRADWAYSMSDGGTWGYPAPVPIKAGQIINGNVTNAETDPFSMPSASFPAGGRVLKLQEAIGAGPLLIYEGKVCNTWREEIWDDQGGIVPNSSAQRSAIGVNRNQKLVLFAAEGRNSTAGIAGLTTKEVADIMLSLGCAYAVNLDGGGSSCLLVNGRNTIIPNGGQAAQRAIVTAIAIE